MKITLGLFVSATMLVSSDGRPAFVSRVPNGNGVTGVAALGHVSASGGGALNVFGEAFDAAGSEWTKELCQQDSDNDGATNGEELGDPCCTWTSSAGFDSSSSSTTTFPTHPGVANSFTNDDLKAMTCGGEADLGSIASSGAVSSVSASGDVDGSVSASSGSAVGENNSSSNSFTGHLNPEDQPSISPRTAQPPRTPSVSSAMSQQSHFVAAWGLGVAGLVGFYMN